MRAVLKTVLAFVLLLVTSVGLHVATARVEVPEGPASRALLQPGPFGIGALEVDFVDKSRGTRPNRDFPGLGERRLASTIWYPAGPDGRVARHDRPGPGFPLIVYSHGFRSTRSEGRYLARHFASHGYVFVAADYPLTSFSSPGGARLDDVVHQPEDVRYLIGRLLGWSADGAHDFSGVVDGGRVGAMGLSLGGMTSTLVAFHPSLRDPRVGAAVSIAGPTVMFTSAFFETAHVPFLMIAGDEDAVVDFEANAASLPERAPRAGLVTLRAGSHIGHAEIARYLFRWANNGDALACRRLLDQLSDQSGEGAFASLGGLAQGVDRSRSSPLCDPLPTARAMRPARQQMLTTLAAFSFFQSRFAGDPTVRRRAGRYLSSTLSEENGDASVQLPTETRHDLLEAIDVGSLRGRPRQSGRIPDPFRQPRTPDGGTWRWMTSNAEHRGAPRPGSRSWSSVALAAGAAGLAQSGRNLERPGHGTVLDGLAAVRQGP